MIRSLWQLYTKIYGEGVGKIGWGGFVKNDASALERLSGVNWNKVINGLKGKNPLATLRKDKSLTQKINDFLDSLLPEHGDRLVIFIDELDRCSPSYAVRLLERIKHYFSNEKITFVFSVNFSELQHTVKKYYGYGFDGSRYLDRFFDLRVQLPKVDLSRYYSQLHFCSSKGMWSMTCNAMIRIYGMELREISRYLLLYQLAVGKYFQQQKIMECDIKEYDIEDKTWYFCSMYVVPIMIALSIVDTKKYYDFIEGRDPAHFMDVHPYLFLGFFWVLLGQDETYDVTSQEAGVKVVTVEEKLNAVYEALFITDYSIDLAPKIIGQTQFDANTKNIVFEIAGLLSKYATYDD